MVSDPAPPKERRRSDRLLLRVPIKIFGKTKDGRQTQEEAEVVIVSRHGALVRSASPFEKGTTIELLNKYARKQAPFRVIWCSDHPVSDRWDVGVETAVHAEDFWGVQFPTEKNSSTRD